MNNQLNLLDVPAAEIVDIWEKIHDYEEPRKYWQDLAIGEVCKNTTRWGNQRLCVLKKIEGGVFGNVKYLDNGKTDFLSLSCLVPASPEDLEAIADADN